MKRFILSLFLATAIATSVAAPITTLAADPVCFLGFCYYPDAANQNSGFNTTDQTATNNNDSTRAGDLSTGQGIIKSLGVFINNTLIPLIFGIALLFFLFNTARYFIIDAENKDSRDKAKNSALYGIAAFVLLVSIWGIVNMFVSSLGITGSDAICPDYLGGWCDQSPSSGGGRLGTTPKNI